MCERERVCACDAAFTSSDLVVTAPEKDEWSAKKKKKKSKQVSLSDGVLRLPAKLVAPNLAQKCGCGGNCSYAQ